MHELTGQRVMVTGARGFLGSHLCSGLSALGVEVYGLSRTNPPSGTDAVRWSQGSLEDRSLAGSLLRAVKPDVVFHLAGHVTAAPEAEHVLTTFGSLLVSTVNLLTLAAETGCRRVVLAGSLTEPQSGGDEVVPGSPYAAAKWAGNAYARMFHQLYGTPVVIVRPFMAYGPRQDRRKLIPHVIRSLLQGQAPKLSGGQWRADWVYVSDVIDGFIQAAHRPGVDGRTIDLGTGTLHSIQEIVGQIAGLLNSPLEPLYGSRAERPAEQVRIANVAGATSMLGWTPKTSLAEGLKQTVDWYREELAKPA